MNLTPLLAVAAPSANPASNWITLGLFIMFVATTVAGEEPDTAAKSAQASTPARPRPPYQWPIMDVAKAIIRHE